MLKGSLEFGVKGGIDMTSSVARIMPPHKLHTLAPYIKMGIHHLRLNSENLSNCPLSNNHELTCPNALNAVKSSIDGPVAGRE